MEVAMNWLVLVGYLILSGLAAWLSVKIGEGL